jgi:hypothetical protein
VCEAPFLGKDVPAVCACILAVGFTPTRGGEATFLGKDVTAHFLEYLASASRLDLRAQQADDARVDLDTLQVSPPPGPRGSRRRKKPAVPLPLRRENRSRRFRSRYAGRTEAVKLWRL